MLLKPWLRLDEALSSTQTSLMWRDCVATTQRTTVRKYNLSFLQSTRRVNIDVTFITGFRRHIMQMTSNQSCNKLTIDSIRRTTENVAGNKIPTYIVSVM